MALTNKTLTIFEVRDKVGTALDKHLVKLNVLDKRTDEFGSNLGRGLAKLGSFAKTAGLIAGGAILTGLTAATLKAKDFQEEFTQLENLNLDKSAKQVKNLENQVLDSAFKVGKNPLDTSKAFFDVQSGTGFFGKNVAEIVEQTGKFSTAVKADFNTTLEGAIKGIKNFNLESKDIGKFFESSAKTVQVGIVTFEQLARVQTLYAGAANTANQSVDSSNKLFAVFTAKAKSAEEAATLTKSAFTDLLKKPTLEAFDKIGIQVFDKQTGRVKQLDKIVAELNEKFKPFRGNDKALNNLINQFTGSEGLVALIGEVAKNGDNMVKTFKDFDNTEFNLEKALKNSKADLNTMSTIIKNKLEVVLTKIGLELVPKIVDGLDYIDREILPGLDQKLPAILEKVSRFATAISETVKTIGVGFSFIEHQFEKVDNLRVLTPAKTKENEDKLIRELGFPIEIKDAEAKTKDFLARKFDPSIIGDKTKTLDFVAKAERAGVGKDSVGRTILDNLKGKLEEDSLLSKIDELSGRTDKLTTLPTTGSNTGGNTSSRLAKDIRGVTAGGDQVRNVTVNLTIQKMNGVETAVTENIKNVDLSELSTNMRKAIVNSVRDAEIALAQ